MFDVAVVGAGPAGATAALTLARRGLKVALLEKDALPRYKTCGGALVARGLALFPTEIQTGFERRCPQAELHLLDRDLHYRAARDPSGPPIMAMTMRDRLDHVLASAAAAAGATLRTPCTVSRVSLGLRDVRLETDVGPVTAAFVIAADGATGALARLPGGATGDSSSPRSSTRCASTTRRSSASPGCPASMWAPSRTGTPGCSPRRRTCQWAC